LAVCAFAALTVGQASAATIKAGTSNLLAIYGYPGASTKSPAVEEAIGGGLGRNFGFGENMLFRADTTKAIGKNIRIKVGGTESESKDGLIGATLMSNKTGKDNPLSFTIQFADFQFNEVKGGVGLQPAYADTHDRPWIAEVCSAAAGTECLVDPRVAKAAGEVKIENVSIDIGPGFVVQGTAWGKWKDGNTTKPPCISLNMPVAAVEKDTLFTTQTPGAPFPAVGTKLEEIVGEACLISANNDWYETHEATAITIERT
jgi:hypothetical protein